MFVYLIQYGWSSVVWLQDIAPSEFTCFDDSEHSNLSGRFVQSVLCKTPGVQREENQGL